MSCAAKQRGRRALLVAFLMGLLGACATAKAPVAARQGKEPPEVTVSSSSAPAPAAMASEKKPPGGHLVGKGDTLYSIAWRYQLDYKSVASWNAIAPPYVIYPGQRIRLAPEKQKTAALQPGPVATRDPARRPPVAPPAVVPKPSAPVKPAVKPPSGSAPKKAAGAAAPASIRWRWPARGTLLKSDSPTARKGIDIAGKTGQKIVAAAPGEVVYSGSGLLHYGRLIIIKHNEAYLSAYAHNQTLMVTEGDKVKGGQQISTMGANSGGKPVLHFEIRRNGKPINPLQQLPKS